MFRALAVSSLRLSLMLPTATFHILYPRPCSKSLVQCGRLLVCSPDEDFTLNGLPRISTESGHVETVSLAKHHSTLRFTSSTDEIICSLKGATCLNAKKHDQSSKTIHDLSISGSGLDLSIQLRAQSKNGRQRNSPDASHFTS